MLNGRLKNNGEIVIWNDETEGEGTSTTGFTSTEIVISPLAKGNAFNSILHYDHSSDLLTLQEIFGVGPCLGGACSATDLADLYIAGTLPNGVAVPEPASLALLASGLVGIGLMRRRRRKGATAECAPDVARSPRSHRPSARHCEEPPGPRKSAARGPAPRRSNPAHEALSKTFFKSVTCALRDAAPLKRQR